MQPVQRSLLDKETQLSTLIMTPATPLLPEETAAGPRPEVLKGQTGGLAVVQIQLHNPLVGSSVNCLPSNYTCCSHKGLCVPGQGPPPLKSLT